MKRFPGAQKLCCNRSVHAVAPRREGRARAGLYALYLHFAALLTACAMLLPIRAASAEEDAAGVTHVTVQTDARKTASDGQHGELIISGWQGAKNYHESFPITVSGGFEGGTIRFLTNNCSVSPATGAAGDTYTVIVTGAGTYSLTAIMAGDATHGEISESCSGVADKADQEPLVISGWGNARNYYRTFTIQVSGGTTNGTVRFQADGCSVSPTTGNIHSVYTVTVTRVGAYSLTALMDGNSNYSDASSAKYTGMAGKADQASIMIEGWVANTYYGDSFPLKIAGGSTSEALTIAATGCEVTKESGNDYTVTISSVGPYSVTASRAGNYGYNSESASVCGVSKRATQPGVSLSGWAQNKNVADSFAIHVKGGMSGGSVHFATTGCTIKPNTGTSETTFIVTVDTVGEYKLTAFVDGDENHLEAVSREYKGSAGKAVQAALTLVNWNENAPRGGSFDVAVHGGSGTGAVCITTNNGCTAIKKSGETSVYTVTVTADNGEEYSLSISKSGDVNYNGVKAKTFSGVANKSAQSTLKINGWKDTSKNGDEFAIQIAGGSGEGGITFETAGCRILPESGDIDDIYHVIVTAEEGESYSLSVNREGDGIYANTSTLRSGSVRHSALAAEHMGEQMHETETPLLGDGLDVFLMIGMFSILLVLLAIALVLQYQQKRYPRK